MAFKYVRTTAKERKAQAEEIMASRYLVAHRNWEYKQEAMGMAPQLKVYKKCIDVAPSVGTRVKDHYGRVYVVSYEGNLVRHKTRY